MIVYAEVSIWATFFVSVATSRSRMSLWRISCKLWTQKYKISNPSNSSQRIHRNNILDSNFCRSISLIWMYILFLFQITRFYIISQHKICLMAKGYFEFFETASRYIEIPFYICSICRYFRTSFNKNTIHLLIMNTIFSQSSVGCIIGNYLLVRTVCPDVYVFLRNWILLLSDRRRDYRS